MLRTWSEEQKNILRANYGRLSYAEIAKLLGKPVGHVKSQASNMKITVSRAWSEEQIAVLKQKYPDTKTQLLADELGRGLTAVYRMANMLGLKKSDEFNASDDCGRMTKENRIRRGIEHRFAKGHVPFNKGLRRPGYNAGRMKETQFQKGQFSHNRRQIGDERLSKEGYLVVKVADGLGNLNWKPKHHIVWETTNGEIPKGHVLAFIDGDIRNFDLSNLALYSRSEWMKRHTVHNYPEDVKAQIHTLAGFKRRLNTHAKKQDRRPQEPAV